MRRILQSTIFALTLLCASSPGVAQCIDRDGTTASVTIRHVLRTGGNDVESGAGTQMTGDYWYMWSEYVEWDEIVGATLIHQGNAYDGGNGLAYAQWDDQPSVRGAGTYSLTAYHEWDSACGGYFTDNSSASLIVNKPTVNLPNDGVVLPTTLWNLGPGTGDPIDTSNGYKYRQSIVLTAGTNCLSGDTCNDTPQWSINSPSSTLQLSSTSGSQVTLSKGSAMGNCQFDTPVSVSLGGFSSDAVTFVVNSPSHVISRADLNLTENLNPGYRSNISWQVTDVCAGGADRLTTLPIYEAFQN